MKISVITRSFQAGAGKTKEFNQQAYLDKVYNPIRGLLENPDVCAVTVMTNGDSENPLSEDVCDGHTVTGRALSNSFKDEIASGRLNVILSENWGANPGSARALTQGLVANKSSRFPWTMIWSPEIRINPKQIKGAISFAEKHQLVAIGFLRQYWWQKVQWNVVQNTAAIWRTQTLLDHKGFDKRCDIGSPSMLIKEFGNVPIAGMEDFHLLLRIMKTDTDFQWGMFGIKNPLLWDVAFEHGSDRKRNHLMKVARQFEVMKVYSEEIFSDKPFEETMNNLFTRYHCC